MTLTKNAGGLQELASGTLPALGGDPLQPSWNRSLAELLAANQALVGTTGGAQPTAAAQLLLGSNRTDFSSLVTQKVTTGSTPAATAFATVEERCRQHRDGIIERILHRERERAQKDFEKAMERRREDDWAKEREWWMKEIVGTRNLIDARLSLTGPSTVMLPGTTSSNLLPGYPSHTTALLDVKMAQDHRNVLLSIPDGPSNFAARMQAVASDSHPGYATAWKLVDTMLPHLSSPIEGALGSLIHFCKQYQSYVKNRVAAAGLAGQDVTTRLHFGSGMSRTVAAFCKLEKGSSASIWHIVYYCLRCGDADAARNALNVGAGQEAIPEQTLVQTVLGNLAQFQGNASCIWEMGNPVATTHTPLMVDLYQKTKNLEPDNTFKISVFALLSGNELSSFETIEDYLFGRLWLALQSENPLPQIENIGASIRKYGPDYFGGAEENGGWGYALPLLATQQFRTALTFLAEAGGPTGLLQATHLGLALSMGGIPLDDLGRPSSTDLLTALLVKYASTLEQDSSLGVSPCLEYLLKIPSKEQSYKELASLICRSPHLVDQFGGIMKDDGSRQEGELDKYLDKSEVALVLCKAAETLQRNRGDNAQAELAAKLYMLAGNYSSLISLLNHLITPCDIDDDTKRYWWTQSQQFYSHYLSKRTLAFASLEIENNLKLVTTNRTLMELRHFFSTLRKGQFQAAFEIAGNLNLLPLRQDDINEKESYYKDLDPVLKDQYPAFLLGLAQCLHGMHRRIKSEARGVNDSVDFQLKDLQQKARFLYIFSGLTGMPSDTKDGIQRYRNNMM